MSFQVGTTIVRRNMHRTGRIAAVETARVLRDDAEGVLTWTAAGSEVMHRTTVGGQPARKMTMEELALTPTVLTPSVWRSTSVLVLTSPGAAHSILWFFDPDGAFAGWYVNLETPARRWSLGLDSQDLALDIWVEPDRSWKWKDEDEFAERTGHPEFWSAAEAAEVRSEGEKLVALIEAGTYPFDGSMTDFRPDPAWEPTALPPMWDLPA